MSSETGILALTEEGDVLVDFAIRIRIEKSSVDDIVSGKAPDIIDTILGVLSHQLKPVEDEFQALMKAKQ